jgi:ATP-binding cassette, subfamily B, bacterial
MDYFKKYFSFIDFKEAMQDGEIDISKIETIEFKNVFFRYSTESDYVLENISFLARNEEALAIVGQNGAGKSTLIHLICRFWDVSEGQILINGYNIKTYKVDSLRACIGAVFQDYFQFQFTVKENVTLGSPVKDANMALERAGFPKQIDADKPLGKSFGGLELSGGQWQKLSIARGLAAEGSLLVLDEPTSAIDPKAEAELYDSFSALAKNKLCFMVTHRLGSVKHADRVLVLNAGQLVQNDHPDILKCQPGVFSELWKAQSDMYQ